jgi:uncharacterized protein (DUF486 family)
MRRASASSGREAEGGWQMKAVMVPVFMFLSSALMALAWLGHLRFRDQIGFWTALGASWLLVLPEYVLNVAATRFGYGTYSGAQMASLHLAFGVVCVALALSEELSPAGPVAAKDRFPTQPPANALGAE